MTTDTLQVLGITTGLSTYYMTVALLPVVLFRLLPPPTYRLALGLAWLMATGRSSVASSGITLGVARRHRQQIEMTSR